MPFDLLQEDLSHLVQVKNLLHLSNLTKEIEVSHVAQEKFFLHQFLNVQITKILYLNFKQSNCF